MARHIIHFTGPINSSTCGNLIGTCTKALQQGATRLQLNIATMGGDCAYGFSLYNYLLALPVPVDTHNLGTVESMGNILFLAGARRTACPLSKFLFHPFHWTLHGSVDHTRLIEYARSLEHDLVLYEDIVRQRTPEARESLDVRLALTGEAQIIDPPQALDYGLIHEIDSAPIAADTCQWSVHS